MYMLAVDLMPVKSCFHAQGPAPSVLVFDSVFSTFATRKSVTIREKFDFYNLSRNTAAEKRGKLSFKANFNCCNIDILFLPIIFNPAF